MKRPRPTKFLPLLRHLGAGLTAALSFAACVSKAPAPEETATTSSAVFANGGFETGAAGTAPAAPWTTQTFLNPGITAQTPQTYAGLNLAAGGVAKTVILASATGPGTQMDPNLGAAGSLRWPRYGNQCAIVNQQGNNRNVNVLSQTMTVAAADVDPSDGQIHVRFAVAPVLQNPAHTATEQPYYFIILTDVTQNTTLYSDFNLSGAGIPWKKVNAGTPQEIDYTDWQLVDISGAGGKIAQGDQVELQIIGAGCSLGGHFGEIYVDGVGSSIPGISVEGTGPAQANAGANVTYTFTYQNGAASAETGVTIDVTTPAGATFQSISAPGLTCITPAVGGTGTIVCTLASIAAGASGTFTVTVNIDAGTTGTVSESAYQITSTQETEPLVGPPIDTLIGCANDAECSAGYWCDESVSTCSPTLPNGSPLPKDAPHTNPTLNGTCTAQAGKLVCTSGVCDTTDNDCGYANGDGPCTASNGGTVCRSGACSSNGTCEPAGGCNVDADCSGGKWCDESTHVCTAKVANGGPVPNDPPHTSPTLNGTCTAQAGALVCVSGVCDTKDNDCGYANGDGPCTTSNGGTVCRSGACSSNGACEPAGGCNVDADCSGGKWCDESTHTCTAKVANGGAVPSDPPHANPTLNGTCTAQAGALVCVSDVCDTKDNKCGYANGDGPCTPVNGGTVCRSGACSINGTCEPAGSCNVDGDCSAGNWCDESTHACTPTLPNGTAVPTDPPHTNPTLNGTCTSGAGALVCKSGVCDVHDNECGYADGDGPCTTGNGGTVCRSGMCSAGGTCEPTGGCNVDADCPTGKWCDESTNTCTPTIANGGPVPDDPPHTNPTLNGTCTTGAGTLACTSAVCDVHDNECGYANGDGPCTTGNGGTVCRSGMCSTSGTCEPMGGCNVDGDCTSPTPVCDTTTHTCVAGVDAGAADAGTADAGTADAGTDGAAPVDASTEDASPAEAGETEDAGGPSEEDASGPDATARDAAAEPDGSQGGFLEGGGLSCAMGAPSSTPPAYVALFLGAALAVGSRRRRPRSPRRPTAG